ncbi:hypothetical protein Y032_0018g3559 [Ancylostoma ceylanicum]|uniref:Uncharacterized protein n=1 Tax=Ancylostoma ceylanicum TaxID=53326 RepID=A0A016V3J8_9BILA|nr:hypothetical protein Y032_0018g3559 [Ancylostoma ceylanicum]
MQDAFRLTSINMEVEVEVEPEQYHCKMGPEEAEEGFHGIVIDDSWLEAEPLPSTSKRPASTMLDRRSKIPLHFQLMMASGPVNGREVVYYPWDNAKRIEGRRSKKGIEERRSKKGKEGRRSKKGKEERRSKKGKEGRRSKKGKEERHSKKGKEGRRSKKEGRRKKTKSKTDEKKRKHKTRASHERRSKSLTRKLFPCATKVRGRKKAGRTNMEVEAEAEPKPQHRKMGPKEAKQGSQGGVVNDSWLGNGSFLTPPWSSAPPRL